MSKFRQDFCVSVNSSNWYMKTRLSHLYIYTLINNNNDILLPLTVSACSICCLCLALALAHTLLLTRLSVRADPFSVLLLGRGAGASAKNRT